MAIRVLYFGNATQLSASMAKKCRNCSYRVDGVLAAQFSLARKNYLDAKVAVVQDDSTKEVIGWGAIFEFDYQFELEIMLYVKCKYRRQGYGTKIAKKLMSKVPQDIYIKSYVPESDPFNNFFTYSVNDKRII